MAECLATFFIEIKTIQISVFFVHDSAIRM